MEEYFGVKYTFWDKLTMPFVQLRNYFRDKKWERRYRRQRAKRGYSSRDMQQMREWYVDVLRTMLLEKSEKFYDYPDETSEEGWHDILARMAQLLAVMDPWEDDDIRTQLEIGEHDYSAEASERIWEVKEQAKEAFFALFSQWFYHL